ncbi:DUF4176 domain-containing protein [Lactococcus protaetiae]|uniref:DUF4176 domain-containing protein n=1 Tax=Lactococcus protaetiae TaxID=2592653 RepID=A0A514ZA09_9LACT|nr:DUF4176 domain-containing protein [Lactococcus protaetiae]QDK71387.1 DUF4176 domain-containing protein [Lactococcus protaetiae]
MTEHEVRLLPLGSIVEIKEESKPHIIVARAIKKEKESLRDRYRVAPYPEGDTPNTLVYSIEAEQIQKVVFKGYSSEADQAFLDGLIDMIEKGIVPQKTAVKTVEDESFKISVPQTQEELVELLDDDPFYKFRG